MPKAKAPQRSHYLRNPLTHISLALLLFVVTIVFARDDAMSELEKSIFHLFYDLPDLLLPFFLAITQFGGVYMLLLLGALFIVKQHYHIVIRLLMSGLLAYLASGVAKDLWGRPRPAELLVDISTRDYLVRGPGFPSGHSAMAMAIGLVLYHHLPKKYRWTMPLLIILVGISRIYLGVHAPLDIIGGFAIGWGSYALFRNVRLTDIRKSKA